MECSRKTARGFVFFISLLSFSLPGQVFGVGPLANYPDGNPNGYIAGWYLYRGVPLPFRIMYPKDYDPNQAYPLVLTLHGSDASGTNNTYQVACAWTLPYLLNPTTGENYENFKCFVIAPQYTSAISDKIPDSVYSNLLKTDWNYISDAEERRGFVEATLSLIQEMQANTLVFYNSSGCTTVVNHNPFNIDSNKIYCTGFSQGGYQCFAFAKAGRDLFAGFLNLDGGPFCLNMHEKQGMERTFYLEQLAKDVERYKHLPFLMVTGIREVIANDMPDCYNALTDANAVVHWVTNGGDHGWGLVERGLGLTKDLGSTIWTHTFDPNVGVPTLLTTVYVGQQKPAGQVTGMEWLFAQNRANNPTPGEDPYPDGEYNFPKKNLYVGTPLVCSEDFVRIKFQGDPNQTGTLEYQGLTIPVGDRNGKFVWGLGTADEHEFTGIEEYFVQEVSDPFPPLSIVVCYKGVTGVKDRHNFTVDTIRSVQPGEVVDANHTSIRPECGPGQSVTLLFDSRKFRIGSKNNQLVWEPGNSAERTLSENGVETISTKISIAGDANLDGYVDYADEMLVRNNLNSISNPQWQDGDLDDDGHVTQSDLQIVLDHFGEQGCVFDCTITLTSIGRTGIDEQLTVIVDSARVLSATPPTRAIPRIKLKSGINHLKLYSANDIEMLIFQDYYFINVGMKTNSFTWRPDRSDEHMFSSSGELYSYTKMFHFLGDVNNDGIVDTADYTILRAHWWQSNVSEDQGDINGDGTVDLSDANIFWAQEGKSGFPQYRTFFVTYNGLVSSGAQTYHSFTVDVQSALKLQGTIELEDYVVPTSGAPVTVSFYDAASKQRIRSETVTLTGNPGTFSISNVEPGTYDIVFTTSHWLQKIVPNVQFTTQDVTLNALLINGDADANNEVDLEDAVVVISALGSVPSDPLWNPNADLDGSGQVDTEDVDIVTANVDQVGDGTLIIGTITYSPYEYGYPLTSVTIKLVQNGSVVESKVITLTGTSTSYGFITNLTGACSLVIDTDLQTGWFGDSETVTLGPKTTTADFNPAHAIAGDLDCNRVVDFDDYQTIKFNFGKPNPDWSDGDVDGDGAVTYGDYQILRSHYGNTGP